MVRPSIQSSSRSRCAKAAAQSPWPAGVPAPRYPIIGACVGVCALAVSGNLAAPQSSVMTSRRFIASLCAKSGFQLRPSIQKGRVARNAAMCAAEILNLACRLRAIRLDSAMSELRPVMLQDRCRSGHCTRAATHPDFVERTLQRSRVRSCAPENRKAKLHLLVSRQPKWLSADELELAPAPRAATRPPRRRANADKSLRASRISDAPVADGPSVIRGLGSTN